MCSSDLKNSAEVEVKRFMRACRLLELILKTVRVPDAALVPLILMPSVACLVKCSKSQVGVRGESGSGNKYGRIVKILGRVTNLKEVQEPGAVDEEILNGMVEDIQKYCKGKLDKKVRQVLASALKMLAKCFSLEIDAEEMASKDGRQRKRKSQLEQSAAAVATATPPKPSPKSNKKRRQSAPSAVNGNGNHAGTSKGMPKPTQSPPPKKKRKSTAT